MDLSNSRINRRTFGGLSVGAAAALGLSRFAVAQDATPEAEVEDVASASTPTLAELEAATQVDVVVHNTSYAPFLGDESQSGWFVFNVENTSEADASFNLVQLPEGMAVGDFTTFLFQLTSGQLTEMPEWINDATFAGGTYAEVGETSSVMVHLTAGEWVIFSNLAASAQRVTTFQVFDPVAEEGEEGEATAEVEAEATPVAPEVVMAPEGFGSTFTVSIGDGAIDADSSPSAGYNVIGVRNDAAMAANFVLLHVHEAVEDAAAADIAAAFLAGEESDAHVAGGMGVLSPNAFGYIELEAESGSYVGFSSVVNASGGTQLEDGAVIVFNVD